MIKDFDFHSLLRYIKDLDYLNRTFSANADPTKIWLQIG